ncbi:predicted protein [Botrytis cinerea T4]|uniref:Uncharacterized protein n=1 Tax=Botryotinia fuckeliana (strain T4) TaxID=999810 RepID=G2YHG8_BOTF4|nr:predicted protein [Botrytis cinerea T4]
MYLMYLSCHRCFNSGKYQSQILTLELQMPQIMANVMSIIKNMITGSAVFFESGNQERYNTLQRYWETAPEEARQ